MGAALTSRERMRRMLERREQDRIPRHDSYWPETITRWQGEGLQGGYESVLDFLQNDVAGVCWSWPVPFPGRREVLSEDAETIVLRGSMGKVERTWKHKSGTPQHVEFGCNSRKKWEEEYKPALLKAAPSVKPAEAAAAQAKLRSPDQFCVLRGIESFEAMRQLAGDEIVLPAMLEEPEWVRDMSRTYTDLILREHEGVLAAGAHADALWVYGDVGYNHGPFFSPALYRDLILPDHKRLCDWAHAKGLKFIYHTDGDVRTLLPLFTEAGFDALQPLEAKAHMDVRQLAPLYGRRLSFFGNIDMTVAETGERARIEDEVRTKLAAGMAARGYAYHSDHSVPPTVSWENYRFIIGLVERYGVYR